MKYPSLVFGTRWSVGSMVALCLCLGKMDAALAENLAPDAGFESSMDGWEIFIGPEHRESGAVTETKVVEDVVHEGSGAAQMTTDIPIRYAISTSPKVLIPVDAGERYRISGWVKFSDDAKPQPGRATVYIRLALMEGPKQPSQDPLGNIHVGLKGEVARTPDVNKLISAEVPKEWHKIDAVVEIPPGQTYVSIGLFVDRIKGTATWDDIVLEKVDNSAPLSPEVTKG